MNSKITWEDLRQEFLEIGGPGECWRSEVKRICQFRIRQKQNLSLPAELFGFVDWDAEDLAQTVITDRLLARRQAQFIVDTVDSIDHARRLLSNEVSFTLEDRRVKQKFKLDQRFKALTKKPIEPSDQEVRENSRARSAKLRVAQRSP
ncbi:16S rRNA (cytosine(1402)-N(4))-methyltransferase [bacterium]|nr:16S rRNA (cytosine(1402)-N(4))-methyltransferase [bacterium]